MQTKKRAKAVKFGKKTNKPVNTEKEKEVVKPEPVIEQKEEKEIPPEQIESKPIEPQPEEQKIPQEEELKITEIQQTEIQQTEIKEVTIEPPPQAPPQEPPKEPPVESPLPSPEEPTEESQETTVKVEASDTYTLETKVKKNFLGYFMLISIISFIIGLLSMAGINTLNQKTQNSHESQNTTSMSVTKKVSPTNTPSPTPEPLNLSQYNIKILNGSGITGAAAKLKNSLTGEGFTVTTTGNATGTNYSDTTVFARKDINPKYLEKLKSFLKQSYTLASDSATPGGSTTESDVIIIIGKK
jgi:hypothetical protein